MAQRPIFVPRFDGSPIVEVIPITFTWFSGFARSQAQRSINSLHEAAAESGVGPVLEISTKSADELGIRLSAFNLTLVAPDMRRINVEAAFQGSKVFENGSSYPELYSATGRDAKTDERIRNSGDLKRFNFMDEEWPLVPRTAFYDFLYIKALTDNPDLADRILEYKGFSDIAFNPEKSFNCQARSAALYVALHHRGLLGVAIASRHGFINVLEETNHGSAESKGVKHFLQSKFL